MPTIQRDVVTKTKEIFAKKRLLFQHLTYKRKTYLNQYVLHHVRMKIALVESNGKAINLYEITVY